jgi:hypothetical protein
MQDLQTRHGRRSSGGSDKAADMQALPANGGISARATGNRNSGDKPNRATGG